MTDITVRTYSYYGRVRAITLFNGEDCYSEGDTVADALIELGIYLASKQEKSKAENQVLMELVLEGQNDEIRDRRKNG